MPGGPPERRLIRLFPDYGRDWPLWESSVSPHGYTTTPETYGLSAQLSDRLARWNAWWEAHFDPFAGWDSEESREQWCRDGEQVSSQLRCEVAAFADVEYRPWPLR